MRRRFIMLAHRLIFAVLVAISPTEVAVWRLDPAPPPARLLLVGDPVVAIWSRGIR